MLEDRDLPAEWEAPMVRWFPGGGGCMRGLEGSPGRRRHLTCISASIPFCRGFGCRACCPSLETPKPGS